jgi:hypothetical protein
MSFYDDNGFFTPDPPKEPKKESGWVEYKDFNPDHQISSSGRWVEPDDKGSFRYVLEVKGLGVLVMRGTARADDPSGRLVFEGVSIFTEQEIGNRR